MSIALWTAEAAAEATGGTVSDDWNAGGVSIDSRSLAPGDLFIALKGPHFDGHDFLNAAYAAGAAAAMVDDSTAAAGYRPLLQVDDTLDSLNSLGIAARQRTAAVVIAVTGSVGKTGVKEALASLLAGQGETGQSAGSFNNHIGVPLSLARLPASARFWVLELGMNHAGELTSLAQLARPDVALITNVEAVHTAYFSGVEDIAEAKAEIFAGLKPGGTAILNRDNPHFPLLAERAQQAGAAAVLGFGADAGADFRLLDYDLGPEYSSVKARFRGRTLDYRLGLTGRHWVQNSLAILAAIDAAGADVFQAAAAMAELSPAAGRGRRHFIDSGVIQFLLIDESYNASPVSMAATIDVLSALPGGRRIAVLGDMLELGGESEKAHRGLAAAIAGASVDLVFTAGEMMAALSGALPPERQGAHAGNAKELAPILTAALKSGDVVLVKGSAGSRMGVIVEALKSMAGTNSNGEAPDAV
jgi:UDP-N-acetylmuramoyl-tripeptide--D-alanyl-D-alanine ligase